MLPVEPEIPPHKEFKEPVGPVVGVVIILILLLVGAIYFGYARTQARPDSVPYIPGDTSTTSAA